MKILLGLLILFFTFGCIPSSQKSSRRSNNKLAATPKATPKTSGYNKDKPPVFWFVSDTATTTVFVNQNNKSVLYMRGSAVETFLATNTNYNKTFCLITSSPATSKVQLRSRALPFIYRDVTGNNAEWMLKIDIADIDASSSVCGGTALTVTNAQAAFQITDLCPNCSGIITPLRSYLFAASTTSGLGTQVSDLVFNIQPLAFKIDTKSLVTNPAGQCSDSACRAQNFDCCVATQCAINGAEKPNASLQPDYAQSVSDRKNDYTLIKNYKHLYYVCPNLPYPTPTATATPDADAEAQAKLALQKTYWQCLSDATTCAGLGLNYNTVQTINWNECGCKSSTPSVDCKNWNYTPIYDVDGSTILRFECYTPSNNTDSPLKNLKVDVPGRSVPHRFFLSTTGEAVDSLASLVGSTSVNEGSQFSYLNETDHADPQNVSFNMNAILGQMTVDLGHALPAKVVEVESGTFYILSANKGTVNLCTDCNRDFWNESLSAFPSSSYGSGLRAYGHTTTRDLVGTNITNGNYEDTLFGRACFVPPTMIAFSHQKSTPVSTQRLNRLETQAALYMNGYKRDWYGFNLGAVIGSFDGVRWFAIGQGRQVTATSSKLFLAINAPMADLNDTSSVTVNILKDTSGGFNETFTQYDWEFALPVSHPNQNQGASCQQYHQCDSDGDCITQLGWEYMCADVTSTKTYWPEFTGVNNKITEVANSELTPQTSQIQQKYYSTTGGKRCVYRGAGAVCKQNFLNLPTTMRKNYTCAPNFYCAALSASDFNQTMTRETEFFNGLNFGQDADVPGRPTDYVTASNTLSATAISNLRYNFINQHASFTTDADYGLCRPGKRIDTDNPIDQHLAKDPTRRTDYISQIAACDSTMTDALATFNRTRSCPVLDANNNYTFFTTGAHALALTRKQNLCGAESLDGSGVSAFTTIEGAVLSSSLSLTTPTFAKDACFRRAGATCFTDYDCAPNKMHADLVANLGTAGFGGNQAEATYWEEYLVCGQKESTPALGSTSFASYDLTQNKCCRPLGQTVTVSTGGNPDKFDTVTGISEDPTFDATFDETKQSVMNPGNVGRYSRYTVVDNLGDNSPAPNPYYAVPALNLFNLATATVPEQYQWMTLSKASETTCCGGGWVRKFSDGGHDWTKKPRLNISYEDFKCLNYINDVPMEKQNKTMQIVYEEEASDFCYDPLAAGPLCWQMDLNSSTTFTIVPPTDANTAGPQIMSTHPAVFVGTVYAPYAPSVPSGGCSIAAAPAVADTRTAGQLTSRVVADGINQLACIYLPSYINGFANIRQVDILHDAFPYDGVIDSTDANVARHSAGAHPRTFWEVDAANGIFIWGDSTAAVADDLYVRIYYNAPQTENYRLDGDNAASNIALGLPANPEAMVPGNDLYYLNQLGRLELLGVPQITYPALYCNSNRSRLVPGIFDDVTRTDFEAATSSFTDASIADPVANANQKTTTNQNITLNDVFSSDETVCCSYLGTTVDSVSKCCTNYGVTNGNGKFICKLPARADLNVYFNRFISGDGVGSTQPGGGFLSTDFNPMTGEPNLTSTVYAKLKAMGAAYCETGLTVTGGAFGNYETSPISPVATTRYWGIVDEINDVEPTASVAPTPVPNDLRGAAQFSLGFKWNHHFYCTDP